MPLAEQIGSQLQYLRRYARALTGSQSSGDAYVAAMLETVIESPASFDLTGDPKVECFRIFSHLWNSIKANSVPEAADTEWEQVASKKLDRITPMARQVFLLQAVEGFTTQEISKIVGASQDDVVSLLNQASSEIAEQVMSEVLIIEDEPLIAMDIEALVSDLGHTVTGIARTHKEAVALAMKKPPGIVLADIQLADGSSG
ncbi:MAG: response regulator, partial [Hyphomicrobiales bacterium]|nr:response regulator [Hyphomicrobiales bacterium]